MSKNTRMSAFLAGAKAYAKAWREYRYGNEPDKIVELADEIRRISLIDENSLAGNPDSPTAQIRKAQSQELSEWLQKVKDAATKGDPEFFEDTAKAIRFLKTQRSAKSEVIHYARLTLADYRRAGIEPRKADIKEEVLRFRKEISGRVDTVSWQRDVWPLHYFAGIEDRTKGESPRPLPDEWR